MRSHAATSIADVDVGGIGVGGGDHVAGSMENAIVWVGADIIKELANGQRCGFSGRCLSNASRADGDQELVIHSSSVKEKGTNNALDAFDDGVIKRRTGV